MNRRTGEPSVTHQSIAGPKEAMGSALPSYVLLIFTNLIMLPMTLSYTGVSKTAALRSLRNERADGERVSHPLWNFLDKFTTRRYSIAAISVAVVLAFAGAFVGHFVQIGDINPGAPELRQNSQYNRDNAYIIQNYAAGSDTFVVMVDTPINDCMAYPRCWRWISSG